MAFTETWHVPHIIEWHSCLIYWRQLWMRGQPGQKIIYSECNLNILDTEILIENTHFKEAACLLDLSFVRKIHWHQHDLSAFLVTAGYQSHLFLHMCSLGELGFYRWHCLWSRQGEWGSGFGSLVQSLHESCSDGHSEPMSVILWWCSNLKNQQELFWACEAGKMSQCPSSL